MFNYDFSYYFEKHKKAITIGSIVLFLALIIGIIAHQIQLSIYREGKIAVPMRIVPSDAKVTLEDNTRLSGGTVYIAPGVHIVTIEKEGFATLKKEYRIEAYNQPAIYAGLQPESEAAKAWQERHMTEYKQLEVLAAGQAAEYSKAFQERNPLVAKLPFKDPYFTISYRNVDDESIRLTIWGTSPRYRLYAINKLRDLGAEPTDYEIEFENYKNPLGEDK